MSSSGMDSAAESRQQALASASEPAGFGASFRRDWRSALKKQTRKRLPVIDLVQDYSKKKLVGDIVSGVTVGLMTVPQALAYGIVAGLPPNYGLYSAFMGSFVYLLFGTTDHLCIGPTAVMALLTQHYASHGGEDYAVLLAFITGIVCLIAPLFKIGFIVNFISKPVISSFCSAAAVTIICSQLKPLLGIKVSTDGVVDTVVKLCQNIAQTRWQDLTLGLCCIALLVFLKNLSAVARVDVKDKSTAGKAKKQVTFILTVGRNALVVIVATTIAYFLADSTVFTLTGYVEPGLPDFGPPPFNPSSGNATVSFLTAMQDINYGILAVPFIAMLDNIAIIQAVYPGANIDTNQEVLVLGFVNILGSFFRSMPVTGSLSRTAVNKSSGGMSAASGVLSGAMVLLALAFLTPAFSWIPRASLAAVIMCAVVHMIDFSCAICLFRTSKRDFIVWSITFFTCLYWSVEVGVLAGAVSDLLTLLVSVATPDIATKDCMSVTGQKYIVATPSHGLRYPSAGNVRTDLDKIGRKKCRGVLPVILDCKNFVNVDYTAAKSLANLIGDFHKRNQRIFLVNLQADIERIVTVCCNNEERILGSLCQSNDYGSLVDSTRHSLTCVSLPDTTLLTVRIDGCKDPQNILHVNSVAMDEKSGQITLISVNRKSSMIPQEEHQQL